jgi:hypothetical protein
MGMFDSIYLNVKCPYCEEESEIEAQTKDLECNLEVWKVGDFIGTKKYKSLFCITECRSNKCLRPVRIGNIGNFFNLDVFLKKGILTSKYKIR